MTHEEMNELVLSTLYPGAPLTGKASDDDRFFGQRAQVTIGLAIEGADPREMLGLAMLEIPLGRIECSREQWFAMCVQLAEAATESPENTEHHVYRPATVAEVEAFQQAREEAKEEERRAFLASLMANFKEDPGANA